ncbi:hypothetical protein HY407_02655 [Candidatus Gottesmanbacteria bacterium]|nr:hypothetical protein [Candidatus Gottesmanbacteria bacterium]
MSPVFAIILVLVALIMILAAIRIRQVMDGNKNSVERMKRNIELGLWIWSAILVDLALWIVSIPIPVVFGLGAFEATVIGAALTRASREEKEDGVPLSSRAKVALVMCFISGILVLLAVWTVGVDIGIASIVGGFGVLANIYLFDRVANWSLLPMMIAKQIRFAQPTRSQFYFFSIQKYLNLLIPNHISIILCFNDLNH